MQHYSVMGPIAVDFLAVESDGVYVDCTTGLGGHARLIAAKLVKGFVVARDRDLQSLDMARANTAEYETRMVFQQGKFSDLKEGLGELGIDQVNGLIADLGVSRFQLTTAERGFSFSADGPIDMRMDASVGMTAGDLVNFSPEKALADLIYQLGNERRARQIAGALVRARPLRSTAHLADVVSKVVPKTSHIHPATKTFMALRMAVNQEPQELDALLETAPGIVAPGGRIVIISFMSGEDRKVKQKFRDLGRDGRAEILTKKPLEPSEEERWENPASRSAKLRALEMKER